MCLPEVGGHDIAPPDRLGATPVGDGRCAFVVWAPIADRVEVVLGSGEAARAVPLDPAPRGYHRGVIDAAGPGARYRYRLDGGPELPDPASRSQPEGVHGRSEVVDGSGFEWTDGAWFGVPLSRYVLYELHVGTFTPEGTFDAAIPHLDELRDLGVTAVESMPVAQFPGDRNWGYDGVYPFAVQDSYGGPEGLKRLVDACHARGLAFVLDVVYNHLGPEGNYLREFGPYFTDRHRTPWGDAVNVDGRGSDEVRRFFLENARQWLEEFHVDALRLDAIHGIFDPSARPFLKELAEETARLSERLNRRLLLIAESDLGDPRVVAAPELGGFGLDAQWADDFHHAVHALLTGERNGYYQDFGSIEHLARALGHGYVYTGQYSVFRQRRHGAPTTGIPAERFVVCIQNHDQVGNRPRGERLASLVGFEKLKLAAGILLLSPFVPLLFMGEEDGEEAPFLYFTGHSDPKLAARVRRGRRREFREFGWAARPADPQDPSTFERSKLRRIRDGRHGVLRELHRELLRLRRDGPALGRPSRDGLEVSVRDGVLVVRRWNERDEALAIFNVGHEATVSVPECGGGRWTKGLDSADERWEGPGSLAPDILQADGDPKIHLAPTSFVVYRRDADDA